MDFFKYLDESLRFYGFPQEIFLHQTKQGKVKIELNWCTLMEQKICHRPSISETALAKSRHRQLYYEARWSSKSREQEKCCIFMHFIQKFQVKSLFFGITQFLLSEVSGQVSFSPRSCCKIQALGWMLNHYYSSLEVLLGLKNEPKLRGTKS